MAEYITSVSNTSLCCAWCGKPLGNASSVNYLNGNQPVCDLCIIKATSVRVDPVGTRTGNTLYVREPGEG